MGAQTLIFCIGAAKSGTSWLWDYLYGHPQVYLPAVKEPHYFDALEKGGRPWFHNNLGKVVATAEKAKADGTIGPFRAQMLEDGKVWLDAFDGMTANDVGYLDFIGVGREGAKVVGDFTPSYALMNEASFARMAGLAEDVRFIFLMRDPVARMWSNVRMDAGKGASEAKLDAIVAKVLSGEDKNIAMRSNYRRTLNRLFKVVPRENVFVEFYERLFRPETIEKLNAFLGLDAHPAEFDKVVHGGRAARFPAGRLSEMVDFLRPQYNFVERLMGDLPAEWQDTKVTA